MLRGKLIVKLSGSDLSPNLAASMEIFCFPQFPVYMLVISRKSKVMLVRYRGFSFLGTDPDLVF